MNEARFRIGELSRRVGVSPELLRAWERRYGLLQPSRTDGGFRLYSEEDVARVRRMQQLLDEGLAASEAAGAVMAETPATPATQQPEMTELPVLRSHGVELQRALEAFDEVQAQWLLDRVLASFQLEVVLSELLLPYLQDLGERWARGEVTVAQEHFASQVIRGRLLALGQGWDRGLGSRVLLACPPNELHDLPLVMFGLVLRRYGWRILFLGPSTPVGTLQAAARTVLPDLIVLAATNATIFEDTADEIAALATEWPVAIAGEGASAEFARRTVTRLLDGTPVTAAAEVASTS